MQALVTGGAGFIGSHLARQLHAAGHDVTVLDDLSTGQWTTLPADIAFIEGDVREHTTASDVLADYDVIYHLAALVSVPASIERPSESHAINVVGTLRILDAARAHDTRVILASSAAIYGHPQYTPIDEAHPTNPTSPYGVDKLAADHYTRLYHDLYDLDTVSIRPFNVYGPGQSSDGYAGVVTTFIEQALAGNDLTVHGDGSQSRDFVYVDDVVNTMLAAGDTEHVGQSFNIATGEAISIRELAETIQELTDTDSDIVHVEGREGDIEHSVADIGKARRELGFESEVGMEEGLEKTIEWYRCNNR